MRRLIANSLKTRSKSVQAAINAYNDTAAALRPPRRKISWEEVVDCSFLSEFDILRDTREDVRERKWATPANRLLMHQFFKLIRAEEEIDRLHMEIRRLVTYMRDEERELNAKANDIEPTNPALALQIRLYWQEKARFNDLHRRRLHAIKKLSSFQPVNCRHFFPGTSVRDIDVTMDNAEGSRGDDGVGDWEEGEDGDEDGDEDTLTQRFDIALDITVD